MLCIDLGGYHLWWQCDLLVHRNHQTAFADVFQSFAIWEFETDGLVCDLGQRRETRWRWWSTAKSCQVWET